MLAAVGAGYGGFTVPLAILWSVCLGIAIRPRVRGHREAPPEMVWVDLQRGPSHEALGIGIGALARTQRGSLHSG